MGLSEAFEEDQLFSFDFSQNIRMPRLPEFADWAQMSRDTPTIFFDKNFCQALIQEIGPELEGKIPVSRGQGFLAGRGRGAAFLTSLIYTMNYSPSYQLPTSGAFWFSPGTYSFLPATLVLLWAEDKSLGCRGIQSYLLNLMNSAGSN